MDIFRRQKFNEAMFAKNRTLAIRVGQYQSSDIKEAHFDYGYIKGDAYKPGGTCAGSSKITFTSIINTFNKLDKIYPEIGLLVDGTYEWVKMGEYFINDIEIDRNRNTTTLDLMDGMFKLNREYVTDLTYPAEIRNIIKEICLKTGIVLANENMGIASMNYRIDKAPKDKKMTFRDVLGLSAQMLGMSCFFNREGKLEVKELTDSGIVITADSYFMHGLTKSEIEYQIAGITCKKDKEILTVGLRTGRSLEIENVFMYQSALDDLYHSIKDIRYYPFNLNYQGHLLLDVGQWVTIKTNTGETFKSPVLSQSFNFKGGLRGRISADSKAGNDAQYSYAGTITKKILQFDNFEAMIQNQIEEADRDFDNKVNQVRTDFNDQVELIKAKSEEDKQKLSDEIDRRFHDFSPAGFDEAKAKAEEALQKAGASYNLAEEAKYIASVNDIALGGLADKFNKQSGKLDSAIANQTALSGNLDALKRTVSSEVNQASEHLRTTTEALSRMTGQMNGFATKSEVRQDVAGLTETFAKLKTDTNDLISGAKSEITAAKTEFNKTADGLSAKMSAVESYVGQDGQRQEALKRYAREETANQTSAIRETISRDYVAKSTYLENVEGTNQRFETLKRENELKLAEYKQGIDGRFTNLSSQIAGKVNQTDFQRVRETSQLYERIFGGAENDVPNNISRMVMSNQIFQTEVGKYSIAGGPNLLRNSRADDGLKYWNGDQSKFKFLSHNFYLKGQKQMFLLENGAVVNSPRFIFKRNTDYILNLIAFDANTERVRITLRKRKKDSSNPDYDEVQTIFDKTGSPAFNSDRTVKRSFKFNTGDFDNGYLLFQYFGRPNVWSGMFMTELDFYEGSNDRKWQPAPEDIAEPIEAVRTQVTQLAGSYAIQNLNSAGDIINGINLGANGNNRIIGKATHITGDTLIDNAVIKSAMIDKLKTANFEAGSVTTNILGAEAVTAEKVKFDTAFIQRLVSQQAFINELFAKQATITKIQSIDFTGNHIKGGKISSLNGVTDFDLQTGWIDMNKEAVGIRNRFDGKPMQFLIFGQGSINGVPSAYTQLMSNRNGQTGIEHTSAGIQIWNGRLGDNIQTAITFYGKSMDFIPNSQGGGVSLNTETRDFKGLNNITATGNISTSGMITANNIFLSGYGNNNLKALFNDIYKNLALLHKNKETKNNYTYSMYGPIN